jgi:hypothetical protein
LEIMNTSLAPFPPVRSEAAWTLAAQRVESYLRAHHVASPAHVACLTADIIGIARARQRPGVEPVAMAMETLDACMGAWFARLMGTGADGAAPALARGRLALAMGGVPARWPEYFLREQAVPLELLRVMREADLGRGPAVRLGHMAPPPVPEPSLAWARPAWQLWSRSPVQRMLSGVVMVLSRIGAVLVGGL